MLTFPSACEGAGGDIHGVQHDLHRALRVPQAVTTAWFATPPCPHVGGSVKLLFPSTGHLRILLDLILFFFSKRLAHTPFPLPCTYILANSIQDTLCFSIALSMTVYSEPYDSEQCVKVCQRCSAANTATYSSYRPAQSPPPYPFALEGLATDCGLPHPQVSLTYLHTSSGTTQR